MMQPDKREAANWDGVAASLWTGLSPLFQRFRVSGGFLPPLKFGHSSAQNRHWRWKPASTRYWSAFDGIRKPLVFADVNAMVRW
jgi:hypothetical protein